MIECLESTAELVHCKRISSVLVSHKKEMETACRWYRKNNSERPLRKK
jgi:hypothetical protein